MSAARRWLFEVGLKDEHLIAPGTRGEFDTPTWYHVKDEEVWFARGGHSGQGGNSEYWVGLWRNSRSSPRPATKPFVTYRKHRWTPEIVTVSRDGKVAASADRFGEIHVWKTASAEPVRIFKRAKHAEIWNVRWGEPSRLLLGRRHYTGNEFKVNHYGPLKESFDLEHRAIAASDHAGDGEATEAFKVFGDGHIQLGDVDYWFEEESFGEVTCGTLLQGPLDGIANVVAIGSETGNLVALQLGNRGTVRVLRRFLGHHAFVTALTQSPDGGLLASSSIDGTIRFWDLSKLSKKCGDIDFDVRGNQVLRVPPRSQSARVGIQPKDRIMGFGGSSFYESRQRIVRGKYRPGDRVPLKMLRGRKNRYSVNFVLQPAPTLVEPLLSLLLTDGIEFDEWVLWSPRGYYDASPNGDRFIGWHVNQDRKTRPQFYKANQFSGELYKPLVIDRILKLRDPNQAIALEDELNRVPAPLDHRQDDKLEQIQPPIVKITAPNDGLNTAAQHTSVMAEIASPGGAPITNVRLEVNGLVSPWKLATIEGLAEGDTQTVQQRIELEKGTNVISVTASTLQAVSQTAEVRVTYTPPVHSVLKPSLPNLYVLAVGISQYANIDDLQYAHLDATDFDRVWRAQQDLMYSKVDSQLLVNDQATSGHVKDAVDRLLDKQPTPKDTVLLMFSGHGVFDNRGNYYLATHDTQLDRLRRTAIAHTEIGHLVSDDLAHCQTILFVDTCHGGAAVGFKGLNNGAIGQGMGDPWRAVGAVVFASSVWNKPSIESSKWRNGAFTEALLEAIEIPQGQDHAAAIVRDNKVSAHELDSYLSERVARLTNNEQTPVRKWPITRPDWDIAQRIRPNN